jgi:hypothetical protein
MNSAGSRLRVSRCLNGEFQIALLALGKRLIRHQAQRLPKGMSWESDRNSSFYDEQCGLSLKIQVSPAAISAEWAHAFGEQRSPRH